MTEGKDRAIGGIGGAIGAFLGSSIGYFLTNAMGLSENIFKIIIISIIAGLIAFFTCKVIRLIWK